METKQCHTCGEVKPLTEFKRCGQNASHMRNCKVCYVSRRRENKANGIKYNQRDYNLFSSYGIGLAEYNKLLESQEGVCAICKKLPSFDSRKKHLVVDHDHDTGEVRGLLCDTCNRGLGLLGDNQQILENATNYLARFSGS